NVCGIYAVGCSYVVCSHVVCITHAACSIHVVRSRRVVSGSHHVRRQPGLDDVQRPVAGAGRRV
ncbi:MAG: hypothetical protein C0P61_007110, partial [Bacillota bacterium]